MTEGRFEGLAEGLSTTRLSGRQYLKGLAAGFIRSITDEVRGVGDPLAPTLFPVGMPVRVRL